MDIYDEHIRFLEEHPDQMSIQWMGGRGLFQFTDRPKADHSLVEGWGYFGCLTMVKKRSNAVTPIPEMTNLVKRDERIPADHHFISAEHLPAFAEYQRELDEKLGVGFKQEPLLDCFETFTDYGLAASSYFFDV